MTHSSCITYQVSRVQGGTIAKPVSPLFHVRILRWGLISVGYPRFFPPMSHENIIDVFSVDTMKPAIVAHVFGSDEWRDVSVTKKTR